MLQSKIVSLSFLLTNLAIAPIISAAPSVLLDTNDLSENDNRTLLRLNRLTDSMEGKFRSLKELEMLTHVLETKYLENTAIVNDAVKMITEQKKQIELEFNTQQTTMGNVEKALQIESLERKQAELSLISQQKSIVEEAVRNESLQRKHGEQNLKSELYSDSEQQKKLSEESINLLRQDLNQIKSNELELTSKIAMLTEKVSPIIDKVTQLEQEVKSLTAMDKAVPKGFIYLQLPFQKSPYELWLGTQWDDVSSKYAGKFFRISGGNAAGFGSLQGESFPRLTGANSHLVRAYTVNDETSYVSINPGQTSAQLWTGDDRAGIDHIIKTSFTMSGGEVRPANYAIRVWQRK